MRHYSRSRAVFYYQLSLLNLYFPVRATLEHQIPYFLKNWPWQRRSRQDKISGCSVMGTHRLKSIIHCSYHYYRAPIRQRNPVFLLLLYSVVPCCHTSEPSILPHDVLGVSYGNPHHTSVTLPTPYTLSRPHRGNPHQTGYRCFKLTGNRFVAPDKRVPGWITGYVRRFWQVSSQA